MEGPLASVATGALQSVVLKLTALLGEEYKRFKRVRKEIRLLTDELNTMKAFLIDKSKVESPGELDKIWTKQVRELSYDIEDIVDEFMLHAADESAKPDNFMEKVRSFFLELTKKTRSLLERTKSRHRIGKEIEDLKEKIDEVAKRNERYQNYNPGQDRTGDQPVANANNASPDPRALVIFEDATKLVGIDGPKGEVVRLLEEDQTGHVRVQQQPRVVSIVGAGGLGKTTLAHQVYQELKGPFNHRVFVSVSRNPDVKRILRTILCEVVDKEDYEAVMKGDYVSTVAGEEQLITKIRKCLADKRYFIVLDDIWDVTTWNVFKNIFPVNNCGSKIITTTRINDVSQECSRSLTNGHIYNIRPLSMAHSTQLFHRRLFAPEEKCPSHLEEISGQILEKCAGLPLAIIAISGLLSSKRKTKEQWDQVKKSIGRELERNDDVKGMLEILSLSYFDLPLHLKTCLLYLSIFPEDHTIGKDNLIRRWIGEGFIHEKNGITAYDLGERCFNDLINRSLIQPAGRDRFYEVNSYRVHDTILDFIVSKAIEDNFVTLIGVPGVNPIAENKVCRLSIQNDSEMPPGLVLSSVRSLNVFGGNVEIPFLSDFRLLRVLAFEDCGQLKDDHLADAGNLLHLKFLHGHNTIMEIPAAICQVERLDCLVTLVVTDDYAVLPDKIADMKALRVLEGVSVYRQSIDFIRRLGELADLRKLGIVFVNSYCDDEWEEKCDEILSSICKLTKANLDSLHVKTTPDDPLHCLLNKLSKAHPDPLGLRELVINGDNISGLAAWRGLLVNLQKLLFCADESFSEEDVETLGSLSNLEYLCIHVSDEFDDSELRAPLERAMKAHPNCPKLIWVEED